MSDIRRINERFTKNSRIGASDIYRKFKIQFDALLSPGDIPKNDVEFEEVYVHDYEFEQKIEDFRNSVGNMASFCVGYTGIGKSTSVRYCFGIGIKNVSCYNMERKELVFPAFFDGHNLENDFSQDLAKKISGCCSFIEKENPDIKQYLRTNHGLKDLFEFIEMTKPEILEVDPIKLMNLSEDEEIKVRLSTALQENKYSYYAIRLKFLISKKYDKYKRLVIVLDDIESLPHQYQQDLIRLYLSFYDCMGNTVYPEDGDYNVNMLICLRPHTLRLFNNNRNLETYPISGTAITKDKVIDLSDMFQKRFEYYTNKGTKAIGNIETWKECYAALKDMNSMFSGQYKTMIVNLCFMNIRESLSYYAKIFANRFWVQRNKEVYAEFTVNSSDYIFNNITIIRALSCNESSVYFDSNDNILPCLFISKDKKDLSVYCLLLIKLFYDRCFDGEPYGINAIRNDDVIRDLKSIFDDDVVQEFKECIIYLFERRILRKSIRDKDDYKLIDRKDSLKDESLLYISSKGTEMWRMLSQDSVLLELFREHALRDYSVDNFNDLSSFELMAQNQQEDIFYDLLKYIERIYYTEDDIHSKIKTMHKREKFKNIFGEHMVAAHLLLGVEKSLRYSGKIENPRLKESLEALRRIII